MTKASVGGMDVFGALRWAKLRLAGQESASLDAQLLLAALLYTERTALLAHPEWQLSAGEEREFHLAVERRAHGEPLAYILGKRAFFDREFRVTPATLIPRPETELLLEAALASLNGGGLGSTVADIGTGCGALAICFAAQRPHARVLGSDISSEALAVARQNGEEQGVCVEWECGDLLRPWQERGIRLDFVLANLPYITTDELCSLGVSEYEPRIALDGGVDGLTIISRLLCELPGACARRAQAWLEIGAGQGEAVMTLVRGQLPEARSRLLKDYAGHDRVLHLQLP